MSLADLTKLQAAVRAIAGGGARLGCHVARLGPDLDRCLPWGGLPYAALHEVGGPAASGFVLGLARRFLERRGALVWCRSDREAATEGELYGPGLQGFGLPPERLLYVRAPGAREALWAAAEALRSRAVACTVLELSSIDLISSRRLQIAAEGGGGAGILLRHGSTDPAPNAALTRFRAAPALLVRAAGAVPIRLDLWRAKSAPPAAWKVVWNDATLAFDLVAGMADRANGGLRQAAR